VAGSGTPYVGVPREGPLRQAGWLRASGHQKMIGSGRPDEARIRDVLDLVLSRRERNHRIPDRARDRSAAGNKNFSCSAVNLRF
jgi:hypothetical protein